MSLRGKKDITVTNNLREAGLLLDADSFVRLDGHLCFEGKDKSRLRTLVFKKHRSRCAVCGRALLEAAEPFQADCGAWHHPKTCDCVGCSELRCDTTTGRKCHAHRTPGFKRVAPSIPLVMAEREGGAQ